MRSGRFPIRLTQSWIPNPALSPFQPGGQLILDRSQTLIVRSALLYLPPVRMAEEAAKSYSTQPGRDTYPFQHPGRCVGLLQFSLMLLAFFPNKAVLRFADATATLLHHSNGVFPGIHQSLRTTPLHNFECAPPEA